jgi:hypothetical protein
VGDCIDNNGLRIMDLIVMQIGETAVGASNAVDRESLALRSPLFVAQHHLQPGENQDCRRISLSIPAVIRTQFLQG